MKHLKPYIKLSIWTSCYLRPSSLLAHPLALLSAPDPLPFRAHLGLHRIHSFRGFLRVVRAPVIHGLHIFHIRRVAFVFDFRRIWKAFILDRPAQFFVAHIASSSERSGTFRTDIPNFTISSPFAEAHNPLLQ